MSSSRLGRRSGAEPPGPGVGRERPFWRRHGRPLAVGVAGLAVVAAVLVSTVLTARGPAAPGHPRVQPHPESAALHRAAQQPGARATTSGQQQCADGRDPTASLRPSAAEGPAVRRIQQRGRLVVGVDQNSYLWSYRDPATGDLKGFDIDLVQAIAEDLLPQNPKVIYKAVATNDRAAAVRDGTVDMVVRTMSISCKDHIDFSTAYFAAGQQLLVPGKHARVSGFDGSLRGNRLCYARKSSAEELMKRDPYRTLGARTTRVTNQLDCLVRLQLGTADAVLTDNALAAGQAAQDPSVRLIGDKPVTSELYGVAMKSKDRDLVRRVNRVLDDYRRGGEDSKWQKSFRKWLAEEMMDAGPPKPKYRD